jgi:hypothetical protein
VSIGPVDRVLIKKKLSESLEDIPTASHSPKIDKLIYDTYTVYVS